MKRSEMIQKIAENLFYRDLANQHQFWYDENDRPLLEEDSNKESYYNDATKFLYLMEEEGMSPPDYLEEGCMCLSCYKFNEWEPE